MYVFPNFRNIQFSGDKFSQVDKVPFELVQIWKYETVESQYFIFD